MQFFYEFINAIYEFTETGGNVLLVIGGLIFVMWVFILERSVYFSYHHKELVRNTMEAWEARSDKSSWNAEQVRDAMISRVSISANANISMIQVLVALCPLLGLLGTVTGMIDVFDVMAVSGTGNARSMASGVSKATIPTMAGMVGALSGVFAHTLLSRMAKKSKFHIEENILLEH